MRTFSPVEIVYALLAFLIGAVVSWLLLRGRPDPQTNELKSSNAVLLSERNALDTEAKRLRDELQQERKHQEQIRKNEREQAETELQLLRTNQLRLSNELTESNSQLKQLTERLQEQKAELDQLQQRFTKEFELLANKIFEEKSQKFADQNRTQLDILLQPLGEKLKDFEKKVNDTHLEDTKERASLKEQLQLLHTLNQKMSTEANNLTRALKGDTQKRGAWGEYILTSILEKSGLVRDREYKIQQSITNEDNQRQRPDVIIYLPEQKHLVIDSKVSLIAYERFSQAETDEERAAALKEHVAAVRRHINELSAKNYPELYALNSLDFVLLFMPIEPAFSAALQGDEDLFTIAFEKNIVLVSPSTLLVTLRTVATIWRQENQNRNALEIARQSGKLYDKFLGFMEDLRKAGVKLGEAQELHAEAYKKLHTGKGNLVTSVEKLKKLGAKTSKSLPAELNADADDAETEEENA